MRLLTVLLRYTPVYLITILGVSLTWLTTSAVRQAEIERIANEESQLIREIRNTVQQEIEHNLQAANTLAQFVDTDKELDQSHFQAFARRLLQQNGGLFSLSWVAAVDHSQRAAYEAKVAPIRDRLEDDQWLKAPQRSRYFPETQTVTAHTNALSTLGWELNSEVLLRRALQAAYDTDTMTITDLSTLPDGADGFIAFVPVPPPSFKVNQKIRGFIRAAYPLHDFIQTGVSGVNFQGHDLYFLSDPTAQNPFWVKVDARSKSVTVQQHNFPAMPCHDGVTCQQDIQFAQTKLRLYIPSQALVLPPGFEQQLNLMRLLALGMTIGLAVYMARSIYQTQQIRGLAQQKTSQAAQISQTLVELQQAQAKLVQSEKMSSLGQLVAGIAHEINNPVNFIHGNLRHIETYSQDLMTLVATYDQLYPEAPPTLQAVKEEVSFDYIQEDFPKILQSVKTGTDRIRQIVLSLRNFSRLDEAELKSVDLHEGIESTLMILQHRLKKTPDRAAIAVVKQYGQIPFVTCYPGLINQVLMNLLSNAIDAVELVVPERSPQITIHTSVTDHHIKIGIQDNGCGMSEKTQASLFNPFFTTKPVGKGTGLGLSICYGIITEKHQGNIRCESVVDYGTTFWLEIPLDLAQRQTANAKTANPK
jgi:two-component system, NtrC family, sensor kinase